MENPPIAVIPEGGTPDINKRVWGPWATVGFGIVIAVVFFVIQFVQTDITHILFTAKTADNVNENRFSVTSIADQKEQRRLGY